MNPAEPHAADWIAAAALAAFCLLLLTCFLNDARKRYARPPADERALLKAQKRSRLLDWIENGRLDPTSFGFRCKPVTRWTRIKAWFNRPPIDLDACDFCRDQRNTH